MSRVGKRPVAVPSGVTATVDGQTVKMKGPKGQLQFVVHDDVVVKLENGQVKVNPRVETNRARALYGTARAQVANLVEGVTKGFEKKLDITGVGYRAALQGKNLQLALGYSHDVIYPVPEGITIGAPKPTEIVVTGIDKQKVGQVAAEIRAFRPPEPYKGKGVKYREETIRRKEGKKKKPSCRKKQSGCSAAPANASASSCARRRRAGRGCRYSARRATSTRRSSTMRPER